MVPVTIPGGKPVTAVPGLTPRSPVTWELPVLVTVEPANTAKPAADPRDTGAWAAAIRPTANIEHTKTTLSFFIISLPFTSALCALGNTISQGVLSNIAI